jgi:hypothetical protein
MMRYRCCFVGNDGEVIGVEIFDAAAESVACARAEQLVARDGYAAVVVWDHTQMICRAESGRNAESASSIPAPQSSRMTNEG